MLFDAGWEYRQAKKGQKEQKSALATSPSLGGSDALNEGEENKEDFSDGRVGNDEPSSSTRKSKTPGTRKKRGKRKEQKKHLRRDMYKMFDGSALVVIGMVSLYILTFYS